MSRCFRLDFEIDLCEFLINANNHINNIKQVQGAATFEQSKHKLLVITDINFSGSKLSQLNLEHVKWCYWRFRFQI